MNFKNVFVRPPEPEAPTVDREVAREPAPEPVAAPVASPALEGESAETAIVVGSVSEKYLWMKTRHPGFGPKSRRLIGGTRHPMEETTWCDAAGAEITIYFDISSFYARPASEWDSRVLLRICASG